MDELTLLKQSAPRVHGPGREAHDQARAALGRRMDGADGHRVHGLSKRRLRWIGTAAAAAVAVIAAVTTLTLVGGPGGGAEASAATLLHEMAGVAAKQPEPVRPDKGDYLYVKSENAFLTAMAGDAGFAVLVPATREVWLGQNGVLRETTGKPLFLSDGDRQRWIAAGSPDLGGSRTYTDSLGQYNSTTPSLPSDPNALYVALKEQAKGQGTSLYNEMFVLVGDSLRETSATPAQRAALYEVAARIPGVELVGDVTDSAGRKGVAVAMADNSSHARQLLIFDPQSSMMLGEVDTALPGNEFGYPAGTVIGRATYLVQAVVDSNSALPGKTAD
jgi:hypothetical protein